jgi:hypothetical protein
MNGLDVPGRSSGHPLGTPGPKQAPKQRPGWADFPIEVEIAISEGPTGYNIFSLTQSPSSFPLPIPFPIGAPLGPLLTSSHRYITAIRKHQHMRAGMRIRLAITLHVSNRESMALCGEYPKPHQNTLATALRRRVFWPIAKKRCSSGSRRWRARWSVTSLEQLLSRPRQATEGASGNENSHRTAE